MIAPREYEVGSPVGYSKCGHTIVFGPIPVLVIRRTSRHSGSTASAEWCFSFTYDKRRAPRIPPASAAWCFSSPTPKRRHRGYHGFSRWCVPFQPTTNAATAGYHRFSCVCFSFNYVNAAPGSTGFSRVVLQVSTYDQRRPPDTTGFRPCGASVSTYAMAPTRWGPRGRGAIVGCIMKHTKLASAGFAQ